MNNKQYEALARAEPIEVTLLISEEKVPQHYDEPLPFVGVEVVTFHDSTPIAKMLSTPKSPLVPRGKYSDGTLGRLVKESEKWWFITTERYNELSWLPI